MHIVHVAMIVFCRAIYYNKETKGSGEMSTDAKRAGNERHIGKLDRIVIQPYKEEGAEIRTAAALAGMSVQKYILDAVRDRMQRNAADSQGNV